MAKRVQLFAIGLMKMPSRCLVVESSIDISDASSGTRYLLKQSMERHHRSASAIKEPRELSTNLISNDQSGKALVAEKHRSKYEPIGR
jgi:hypothetical protein